jgi:predicted ATPase
MNSDNLSEKEKSKQTSLIKGRYFNKCFQNIVEEPEQNLFPSSQWEMLKSLLEFNNKNKGNRLIITTHSPYLINYLSISIQAYFFKKSNQNRRLKETVK